ncbi:hypothetical protein OB13_09065 [Pontibacter sp. HJ8]
MEVTNHNYQNLHITVVKGLLKKQELKAVGQALAAAPPHTTRQLWLDCSHVHRDQLSNSSVYAFVNELLKIKREQVKVIVCGMDHATERLFRLLNLDMHFTKAKTLEEACPLPSPEAVVA